MFELSAGQILDLCLEMEKEGANFYKALAREEVQEDIRDLFAHLSEEEERHQEQFRDFQKRLGVKRILGEEMAGGRDYLLAIANAYMFPDVKRAKKEVSQFKTRDEALDFALNQEKNSLLLYEELARFVREPEAREAISGIIAEEKGHIVKLSALKGRK